MPLRSFAPRCLLIGLLALLATLPCTAADKVSDPRAYVQGLVAANDLDQPSFKPWKLRVSYTLHDALGKQVVSQGTVEETWAGLNQTHIVIDSPSYHTADAPKTANREAKLVEELLQTIVHPITALPVNGDVTVHADTRKFGITLDCQQIDNRIATTPSQTRVFPFATFCDDPRTHAPRVVMYGAETVLRNGLGLFRGVYVGLDVSIGYNGKDIISGHVESLRGVDLAAEAAATPAVPGAGPASVTPAFAPETGQHLEKGVAAGMIAHKEQPIYPEEAKIGHISGTVVVAAIIGKDGSIASLDVMASPDPSLSKAALKAVQSWKYRPYLLHGQPVEVDTIITVNFNMTGSML